MNPTKSPAELRDHAAWLFDRSMREYTSFEVSVDVYLDELMWHEAHGYPKLVLVGLALLHSYALASSVPAEWNYIARRLSDESFLAHLPPR